MSKGDAAHLQLAGLEATRRPPTMLARRIGKRIDRASYLESQVVPHQEISSHLGRRFARGTDPGAPRASRWSNLGAKMATAAAWLAATKRRILNTVRALGPVAAIALIVPGGSLIALFWLGLRHRKAFSSSGSR